MQSLSAWQVVDDWQAEPSHIWPTAQSPCVSHVARHMPAEQTWPLGHGFCALHGCATAVHMPAVHV